MTNSTNQTPCSDPDCRDGKIIVHDAYAADPLVGKSQTCDRCSGRGFVLLPTNVAIAN